MKLYIREHPRHDVQPWWKRFEETLVPPSLNNIRTDAQKLVEHVEDRRTKLEAHGALLKWESDTGMPYLKFSDEKDMAWFLLKYT